MKLSIVVSLTILLGCSSTQQKKRDSVLLTEKGKQVKTTEDLHVLVGCKMSRQVEVTFDEPSDGVILLRNLAGAQGGDFLANPEFGDNPEEGKKYLARADLYRCRQ